MKFLKEKIKRIHNKVTPQRIVLLIKYSDFNRLFVVFYTSVYRGCFFCLSNLLPSAYSASFRFQGNPIGCPLFPLLLEWLPSLAICSPPFLGLSKWLLSVSSLHPSGFASSTLASLRPVGNPIGCCATFLLAIQFLASQHGIPPSKGIPPFPLAI